MKGRRHIRSLMIGLSALALAALACTCGLTDLGGLVGGGGGGDLGDYVWLDLDGDGIQDEAEQGIPGIPVRLLDAEGQVVQETTSDDDGLYAFSQVEGGEYVIEFDAPPDFGFTLQDAGSDDGVDSDARQSDGRTASFEVSGADDSRDAGLIPQAAATAPPPPTETPAPTPTAEQAAEPVVEVSFEHTMPGQYSEIIVRVSGLAAGESVSGQVTTANMSAIDGDGSFNVTAGDDGTAEARITIYQFADYVVMIPDLGIVETVTVE